MNDKYTFDDFIYAIKIFYSKRSNKIITLILFILTIFFFTFVKQAFFVLIFIILSFLIKIYQKYISVQLGIDLILLFTILASIHYGPIIGSITGIFSLFVVTLWNGRFTPSLFFSFFLLAVTSFLAYAWKGMNITLLGIILTIFYDTILVCFHLFFVGGRLHRSLIFASTHIVFNFWLFIIIAPKLTGIM